MSRESIFDDVFDMILSPMDFMMRPEIRPERGPFVQIPKEFKDNMPLSMPLDLIKTDTGIKVKIALAGVKKEDIVAFCVYTSNETLASPCGACRQVMSELLPSNCDIILAYGENNVMHTTMKELLPLSFTSEDIDND